MKLSGYKPCGVLCELTNSDGTMAKLPEIIKFSREHAIPVVTIEDIVTPEILEQFALMGDLYCRCVMGISNPRVALLNNGTEETKGTGLYRETHALLKNSGLNFIGNCESRDLPANFCDVVVCDGFTGNIALKAIEGMGQFIIKNLKEIYMKNAVSKLSALMIKSAMRNFKKRMDHREYGGAPFLGLSKPVIKSHGSAQPKSIMSTIRQARDYHQSGLNERIAEGISEAEARMRHPQ